jgi:hypothetical protein
LERLRDLGYLDDEFRVKKGKEEEEEIKTTKETGSYKLMLVFISKLKYIYPFPMEVIAIKTVVPENGKEF